MSLSLSQRANTFSFTRLTAFPRAGRPDRPGTLATKMPVVFSRCYIARHGGGNTTLVIPTIRYALMIYIRIHFHFVCVCVCLSLGNALTVPLQFSTVHSIHCVWRNAVHTWRLYQYPDWGSCLAIPIPPKPGAPPPWSLLMRRFHQQHRLGIVDRVLRCIYKAIIFTQGSTRTRNRFCV